MLDYLLLLTGLIRTALRSRRELVAENRLLRVQCRNPARISSGLPFVLVDQTAEPIMAHDRAGRR
jgi:hypothetical protein